ncbi:hypothetical protein [Calothrix sp. NIES-2098]|uniref:hypothetical protein n=1 Tax=Calothrix sp. NIES-2098 TaxID=1954171 RepID=UPI000B61D9E5|nr:hypothetical protein NIES2098_74200 [Calothrix sp. NIES-2098]
MFYGYRCYTKDDEPLGWLYTFDCNLEYAWTNKDLHWCKHWKTEKGAKKHFDYYNNNWRFKSKGGYLKIEVMPEFSKSKSSAKSNQQLWNEANRDKVYQSQEKYNQKRPIISFRPKAELLQWLEEERCTDNNGEPETDAALLNRKLEKLRKLEQQ